MGPVIKRIALTLLTTCCAAASFGQCDPELKADSAEIVFDGPVNKFVVQDNYLYAGGDFNTVGKFSGSFIQLDRNTGKPINRRLWPKVNGASNVITDGSGNYILYGLFDKIDGVAYRSIAIINASGNVTSFTANINGDIKAAVVSGGKLYLGGNFTAVNGVQRNRLAAIDLATATLTLWNPDVTNTGPQSCSIECLTQSGGKIYVGGAFSNIGGTPRKNIAAIDINTGSADAWAPQAFFASSPNNGYVYRMLKVNNLLYICGSFDFAGGGAHTDIAAIDVTTGNATSWSPNPNLQVLALANKGDTLYLGGAFYQISGLPRQGFAAYSITSGSLLPITINTKHPTVERIYSILPIGDTLYLGGSFDTINNLERKNLAAFNRLTGAILPFKSHTNGDVTSLINDNGKLYSAGGFNCADMKIRRNIASIDLDVDTVAAWNPQINGPVSCLEIRNKVLYIGGDFTKLNDSLRPYNAAWDIKRNRVLRWNPKADGAMKDIQQYKNDVYIGGDFKSVNGSPRYGLAKLDTAGNLQPWIGITDTAGMVKKLVVYKDSLYVGGRFDDLGGIPKRGLGAVNLITGLATGFNALRPPYLTDIAQVSTLLVMNDTMYVAGVMQMVDTINLRAIFPPTYDTIRFYKNFITSYNLNYANGNPLELWDPYFFPVFDGQVNDIYITPDYRLYVAGAFQHAESFPRVNTYREGIAVFAIPTPAPFRPPYYDTFNIPGKYCPGLLGFDYGLKATSINTMCQAGNKFFFGGYLGDLNVGYNHAAFFLLPYGRLDVDLATDTNTICSGTTTTLHARSSLTYGVTYHWNVNGANISNPLSFYTFTPHNKDSISCLVMKSANTCLPDMHDITNSIVFTVIQTVTPDISITSVIEEESGKPVTVKAIVKDAATGYSIEWFNKGVSIGKTTIDSLVYTKGPGTDSIYAVITPRPDTCYITDTSGIIKIDEKPVGIGNITGDARVMVYPNPFDTYVKVAGLEQGDILVLYDVTGRNISTGSSNSKEDYLLETSKLKTGVYVLKITEHTGALRKTILIQKK